MELLAISLAASAALDHPITVGAVLWFGGGVLVLGGIIAVIVGVLTIIGNGFKH